jgi:hypothetical protein
MKKKEFEHIPTCDRSRIRGDFPGVRLRWQDGGSDRIGAEPKLETRSKLA